MPATVGTTPAGRGADELRLRRVLLRVQGGGAREVAGATGTPARPTSGSSPASRWSSTGARTTTSTTCRASVCSTSTSTAAPTTSGHRNPEVAAAVASAMSHFDIGNHHFPALTRTALAEALVTTAPGRPARKVVYGSGGGEAIDIALKTARHATERRTIVSVVKAYHGHTGLAVGTGDDRFSKLFLSDRPGRVRAGAVQRRRGDGARRCGAGDVAAVIMETIPATYGFPLPEPGYLEAVKRLCEQHGTLYIADEVQTGLDAHRRAVGDHQARLHPGHPRHRQGPVRRHVPDLRRAARRARCRLAAPRTASATSRRSAARSSAASRR